MTVSLILACYNGENFIIDQLESLKEQTRIIDEVIICDDCSTDNSFKIIEEYIKKNGLQNWRVIENANNLGWKANFAHMALVASKDIIFFCDQDDIWNKNKVEIMTNILEENEDIELLVSDLEVKYMADNMQEFKPEPLGNKKYQHMKQKAKWSRIMRPGCTYACKRKFTQDCFKNNWREGLAHDLLLWQYAFCRNAIGYVKIPLIKWRRFEASSTSSRIASKKEFRIVENDIFLESMEAALIGLDKDHLTRSVIRSCKLEKLRKDFFETKRLVTWLKCGLYLDCFPKKRTWLADLKYMRLSNDKG